MKTRNTQPIQPTGYYFDKLSINSSTPKDILSKRLPYDALDCECRSINLFLASDELWPNGFRTRIDIIAPTEKFIRMLCEYEHHLKIGSCRSRDGIIKYNKYGFYKFSSVEIARDTFFDTLVEAENKTESLGKVTRIKWARETETWDGAYNARHLKKGFKNGACGRYSYNFKGGSQIFKIYTRVSKTNKRPCSHEEWKLIRAAKIKEKTGISQLSDLLDYDFEKFFTSMTAKFVSKVTIDKMRLGKWLLGWSRRRKFSEAEILKIGIRGEAFCRSNRIISFADLAAHFMKLKRDIRKKRGRRSAYDEKVLKVDYNKFIRKKIERVRFD